MQRVFETRGFDMTTDRMGDTVLAVRDLAGDGRDRSRLARERGRRKGRTQ